MPSWALTPSPEGEDTEQGDRNDDSSKLKGSTWRESVKVFVLEGVL